MDKDLEQLFTSIQSQERTWRQAGFNELMVRPSDNQSFSKEGFFSGDVLDSILEQVSGSKILSGISRSPNGVLEANWDEGYIKINFPGDTGFLLLGNCGKDPSGNLLFGQLLNDGTKVVEFRGYQFNGF